VLWLQDDFQPEGAQLVMAYHLNLANRGHDS
jgi:hypothetical protein